MQFDELVPGATVRFTVIDGTQYLSARDLIMVVCNKDNNDAGQIWRRMSDDKKDELQTLCLNYKFPGRGQQDQPVITFPGAMKLMMWLPGENAKNFRSKAAEILTRYYAGDKSLLGEIEANAASNEPVAQMARESLGALPEETLLLKRKREELEIAELDAKAIMVKTLAKKQQMEMYSYFIEKLSDLDPDWRKDTRLLMLTKDSFKNVVFQGQLAIESGSEVPVVSPTISISEVALSLRMGKLSHADLCRAGKAAVALYRIKYHKDPEKRKQFVDGAERLVNVYREADRALLAQALQQALPV